MANVFTFCALLFAFGIFKLKGTARLIVFLTGIIFFQENISLFNLITFHLFLIYTLLIAEFFEPDAWQQLRRFPLLAPQLIVFAGVICIGMFDRSYSFKTNLKHVVDYYSSTFLIMYPFYTNFKRKSNWDQLFKFFLISSYLLCLYGFYNYFTKTNPYDSLISSTYNSISAFDEYLHGDRFRINSFVSHPVYYGYLTGILFLITLCHFIYVKKFRMYYLLLMPLLLMNLIMTNSRTPLITMVAGVFAYILIGLDMKLKIRVIVCTIAACTAMYSVPYIKDKIDSSLDVFQSGGQKTEGSDMAMRAVQFDASYALFKKSPIFGNGFNYIFSVLKFDPSEDTADTDLKGFESYTYELLIEQGIIGIVVNIIFFVWTLVYFLWKIKSAKQLSALGIATVIMFLIFGISTGTLNSWTITMAFLGILVAGIKRVEVLKPFLKRRAMWLKQYHMLSQNTQTQTVPDVQY